MPTSQHTFIRDFDGSQFIEGIYCIQNAQLGQTRAGKPFLKALIGDKSGQVAGRMWNISEQLFSTLPTNGFVWLEGQTQPYQGELQIIIQQIGPAEVSDDEVANLLPSTRFDVDAMLAEVVTILHTLEHPAMKALADAYLLDADLMKAFRSAPAAVTMHHAFIGGLLEHTLQLLRIADQLCPLYPSLNRDLVLMGLFLHDLSKCRELNYARGFSYSDEGQLIGHLVMGSLLLQKKAEEAQAKFGANIPPAALMVLHHIIISHHGQAEYGAAKIPSTPEAVFVSRLDELDAKTQMTIDAAKRDDAPASDSSAASTSPGLDLGGNFTDKMWALNTRVYRPDPLQE